MDFEIAKQNSEIIEQIANYLAFIKKKNTLHNLMHAEKQNHLTFKFFKNLVPVVDLSLTYKQLLGHMHKIDRLIIIIY